MKRSRLLLVVIIIAVVALVGSLWVGEGPLWRLVMTKKVPIHPAASTSTQGYMTVKRRGSQLHGRIETWHLKTGFRHIEGEWQDGITVRKTEWNADPRVSCSAGSPASR